MKPISSDITLRAYFAAEAMHAIYARFGGSSSAGNNHDGGLTYIAESALAMADAMLEVMHTCTPYDDLVQQRDEIVEHTGELIETAVSLRQQRNDLLHALEGLVGVAAVAKNQDYQYMTTALNTIQAIKEARASHEN